MGVLNVHGMGRRGLSIGPWVGSSEYEEKGRFLKKRV
jgi:hypothetical protein